MPEQTNPSFPAQELPQGYKNVQFPQGSKDPRLQEAEKLRNALVKEGWLIVDSTGQEIGKAKHVGSLKYPIEGPFLNNQGQPLDTAESIAKNNATFATNSLNDEKGQKKGNLSVDAERSFSIKGPNGPAVIKITTEELQNDQSGAVTRSRYHRAIADKEASAAERKAKDPAMEKGLTRALKALEGMDGIPTGGLGTQRTEIDHGLRTLKIEQGSQAGCCGGGPSR